jgi:hypothetical protein
MSGGENGEASLTDECSFVQDAKGAIVDVIIAQEEHVITEVLSANEHRTHLQNDGVGGVSRSAEQREAVTRRVKHPKKESGEDDGQFTTEEFDPTNR